MRPSIPAPAATGERSVAKGTPANASLHGGVMAASLLVAAALAGGHAWAAGPAPAGAGAADATVSRVATTQGNGTPASPTADRGGAYATAHARASQIVARALDLHAGWTTSGEVLHEAEQAAKAGRFGEAEKLADRAAALAQLSIRQSEKQETAWHAAVVR